MELVIEHPNSNSQSKSRSSNSSNVSNMSSNSRNSNNTSPMNHNSSSSNPGNPLPPTSKTLYLPRITENDTVQQIVQDLAAIQYKKLHEKYVFIFKWKHSERLLPPNERPLKLAGMFKDKSEIKFILRIIDGHDVVRRVGRVGSFSTAC